MSAQNFVFYFFCLTAIFFSSVALSQREAESPMVVKCAKGAKYPIHLTFDDGPSPYTEYFLNVLKEHKVHATFFILSDRVNAKNMPLIKRMQEEGHVIAWHTRQHINHSKASAAEIAKNMTWPDPPLGDYLDKYVRMPYGAGRHLPAVLQQKGKYDLDDVFWDYDPRDWDSSNQEFINASERNPKNHDLIVKKILKLICRNAPPTNGGILLMHDIQLNTKHYIDRIIRSIKASGHELVGLDRIIELKNAGAPFASIATGTKLPRKRETSIHTDTDDCVDCKHDNQHGYVE